VVAPVTGVLAATIPVVAGIVLEGTPSTPILLGILLAILAVVLVSRVADDAPLTGGGSGLVFGLLAGLGLGTFNVLADRLSPGAFLGQLAVFKGVEALLVAGMILVARRPAAVPRHLLPAVVGVGLLDLVGNGGYILATQTGELAVAAVLSSLYPAVTILLATIVLKERVTRSHAVGMALAVTAIVLIAGGDAIWAALGLPRPT
jgi:drug/metabolite transporter (DMT)-like permease